MARSDASDLETHEVPAAVDPDDWRLTVTGAVSHPLRLDRDDLHALPIESYSADFACVEGWVAEDLAWRGVPGAALLDRAGTTPESSHVLVHAMDGAYACGLTLDRFGAAVLATELDGAPLPVEHGGPARLVPTGEADCWESVKWVAEIEVLTSAPRESDTAKTLALSNQ